MGPTNTGSFGAAIGGLSPELAAAVQARQGNPSAGAASQVSGTAPTANPQTMAPPAPTGAAPSVGATASDPSQQSQPGAGSPPPFDSSEAKIIINTLSNRLKGITRLQGA